MTFDIFRKKLAAEMEKRMGKDYLIILTKEVFQEKESEEVLKIISKKFGFAQTCQLNGLYLHCKTSALSIEKLAGTMENAFFTTMIPHLTCCHPERIFHTSKIIYRLENYERNKESLTNRPYIRHLDFAITFYLMIKVSETGMVSLPILYNMGSRLTINEKELYRHAEVNTPKLLNQEITFPEEAGLLSMMMEVLNIESDFSPEERELAQELIAKFNFIPKEVCIMSNQYSFNGVSTILYPDSLKALANKWNSDLILCMCSCHDVVIEAYHSNEQLNRISRFIKEQKEALILAKEFLSDHIYLYSLERDCLEIIV